MTAPDVPRLREGWYLMNTAEVERELARWRNPEADLHPSGARPLSIEEALAYRNAGNLPDAEGRTLRLVLYVEGRSGPDSGGSGRRGPATDPRVMEGLAAHPRESLDARRRRFEPDFQEAPAWRRAGSAPVNVLPLRLSEAPPASETPWFEEPELAALEDEWRATGALDGLRIPAEFRSFVYKTVLALRSAGREVTSDTVVASISRWVGAKDVERIRAALEEANPRPGLNARADG